MTEGLILNRSAIFYFLPMQSFQTLRAKGARINHDGPASTYVDS